MSEQSTASDFGSGNSDHDPMEAASEAAGKLRHQVGETVSSVVHDRKERAAKSVQRTADTARDAARQIQDDTPWMAGLIDGAANALNDLSHSIRQGDFRTLLDRAERFGREQPLLFAGAAFAAGMLLVRATRASLSSSKNSAAGTSAGAPASTETCSER